MFKLFYYLVVGLLSRLHIYERRTRKYLNYLKHYVDDARMVVDVGCGTGAFSKALASCEGLVIAVLSALISLASFFLDNLILRKMGDASLFPKTRVC
jgi:hypothetical protein